MNWKNLTLLLVVAALVTSSCGKDDDSDSSPVITTIEATGTSFEDGSSQVKNLNGASSAIDVAINSTITATFDKEVDAATVTTTTVTITSTEGAVPVAVSTSGSSVTIDPTDDLTKGTFYTLTLNGVSATDGGVLASTTRSFTTEGRAPVVVPNADNMIAYWNFDGQADDALGQFNADNIVDITYGSDRFGQGNSVATFDGNTSIIEVPGADALMASNDWTLSFWVKTNSDGHVNENGDPAGHFVMGLSAFFGFQFEMPGDAAFCKLAVRYNGDGGTYSEDTFFNGDGMDNSNGGWQGHPFRADLSGSGGVAAILKDQWAHVLFSYDAATKVGSMYLNGDLMQVQDFNLWPDGDVKQTVTGVGYGGTEPEVEPILAFGFIKSIDSELWAAEPWGGYSFPTANHFKGDLDDVRVFKAAYSADDAKDLYEAERP